MKSIGGYFELELPQGAEYHSNAIALNTGRNALEYILRVRGYKRVYLPYYSCEVLLEPFEKLGVEFSFYHINESLEPEQPVALKDSEAILYINYFGLKQDFVTTLAATYGKQLIVDNTQAFYAKPIEGIGTFYSCRKFFGVPDGAYLYCDARLDEELEQDHSWERMTHLLKRIDVSAEAAYADFREQSVKLKNNPIRTMSDLTHRIMASIDYSAVAERRRQNYQFLDEAIGNKNCMSLPLSTDTVPMVYPFFTIDQQLRQRLINNKVYVATYWPNVLQWVNPASTEYTLATQLLPLPIDQRYGKDEMKRIIELI
jgi:hypothetical protein